MNANVAPCLLDLGTGNCLLTHSPDQPHKLVSGQCDHNWQLQDEGKNDGSLLLWQTECACFYQVLVIKQQVNQ